MLHKPIAIGCMLLSSFMTIWSPADPQYSTIPVVSPTDFYHQAWECIGSRFYDISKTRDWARYEHCFDSKIKTNQDAVDCLELAVANLNDPFTRPFNSTESRQRDREWHHLYKGIGIRMSQTVPVHIVRTNPGSPADLVGIKAGDTMMAIGDTDLTNKNYLQVGDLLTQAPSQIDMTLMGANGIYKVAIKRETIIWQTVQSRMLPADIAYLRLESFTDDQTLNLMQKAIAQVGSARGMIIDLRGNGGGQIETVVDCLSLVMQQGAVAIDVVRCGKESYDRCYTLLPTKLQETWVWESDKIALKAARERMHTLDFRKRLPSSSYSSKSKSRLPAIFAGKPIVLLVDKGTASAAEIFAASLQDNKLALLVGERTHGKGIFQQSYCFSNGCTVDVTVGRVIRPNGLWVGDGKAQDYQSLLQSKAMSREAYAAQGRGITPDIAIANPVGAEYQAPEDIQLRTAIDLLAGAIWGKGTTVSAALAQ
jgi:carboxyl-terminal processing protease